MKCAVGDRCSQEAVARILDTKQPICGLCIGDIILSTAPPTGEGVPAFTSLWPEPRDQLPPQTIGVKALPELGRVSLVVSDCPARIPRVPAFKLGLLVLEQAIFMGQQSIPANGPELPQMVKELQAFCDRVTGNDIPF